MGILFPKPQTENPSLQEHPKWHALDIGSILEKMEVTEKGLNRDEVESRLKKFGPNVLPSKPPPSLLEILIRQFLSPLIYILALAALFSIFIGEFTDAAFIAAVLILNASIGGYQEWRAERSAQALQKLMQIRATVERDSEISEISAEGVVPGDIVWLESGNRIPADVRLLMAHGLEVDESLLTGESFPVLKDAKWVGEPSTPLADRLNISHAGSVVIRGRARGVVVQTGKETAVGQLALDVQKIDKSKPPLLVRMEKFTRVVAGSVLFSAIAIALIGILLHGKSVTEMFLFGVALAVSAIPEGLPVALTVALAIGTTRMAKRGVIVRRLAAVEGLGSCTLIASDKTGTLTMNELTVREVCLANGDVFQVTGQGFPPEGQILLQDQPVMKGKHPLLDSFMCNAVLCNEADLHSRNGHWVWRGDPTDIALLSLGHKLGWDSETTLELYPQVNKIPFEPEYQFSASYHQMNGGLTVFVKGAPERVLAMCDPDKVSNSVQEYLKVAEEMAQRGYRVLALAEGSISGDVESSKAPPQPSGLSLLGFVGMIDPLRPGVREAVADCYRAGVAVSMITGDHPVTALAIARDLGLDTNSNAVITGSMLEGKSPDELKDIIKSSRVFARISPHQKFALVNAMKELGHFVAMTGDGVNDAPALRSANIGVAMGKAGTDVARENAELVISDDNFATIVGGIEEGRIAYDNIRNVIYLLISTGAAEVILVTLAVSAGMPLPLVPAQLLWLNLVTNGIQDVALAFEQGEEDALKRKPRAPGERIFNRLMIERTLVGAMVMGGVGFGFFSWALQNGWTEESARNSLLLLMVLFENFHACNSRSETKSAFRISFFRNPILFFGIIIAFLIHVLVLYLPLGRKILDTQPVSLNVWAVLFVLASTILIVMEIHKWSWSIRKEENRH